MRSQRMLATSGRDWSSPLSLADEDRRSALADITAEWRQADTFEHSWAFGFEHQRAVASRAPKLAIESRPSSQLELSQPRKVCSPVARQLWAVVSVSHGYRRSKDSLLMCHVHVCTHLGIFDDGHG